MNKYKYYKSSRAFSFFKIENGKEIESIEFLTNEHGQKVPLSIHITHRSNAENFRVIPTDIEITAKEYNEQRRLFK